MFEYKGTCLFAMALGAALVKTRHSQTSGGFENIQPVRIVALHTIHALFQDRVMLRQIELSADLQMALEAV